MLSWSITNPGHTKQRRPPTTYSLLLQGCGLNHKEAAAIHKVKLNTVRSWSRGRTEPPASAVEELRDIYNDVGVNGVLLRGELENWPADEVIFLAGPVNDEDAQAYGYFSVRHWRAMAMLVVGEIDRPVTVVPFDPIPPE